MSAAPEISIVIPLCNEADTLTPLYEQIAATVETNSLGDFEVIFVDDGSTDESWATLESLKAKHPATIRALRFRRNHGKAAALSAGFEITRGEVVFTMDADLQDEPAEIPVEHHRRTHGVSKYDWKRLFKGSSISSRWSCSPATPTRHPARHSRRATRLDGTDRRATQL